MTESAAQEGVRHYCRNPKCRSKLKTPISNEREAFCVRGCHTAFYRKRCLVCEAPMERKTERQLICGKRRCRNALQARQNLGRYPGSRSVVSPLKNPIKTGLKTRPADDRGVEWAVAVNSARVRAPRRVLDAVFGHIAGRSPVLRCLNPHGTRSARADY
jgi:hypothetical protein